MAMAVAVVMMTSNNPTTMAVIMFGIIVVVLSLPRFIQCDKLRPKTKESYLVRTHLCCATHSR